MPQDLFIAAWDKSGGPAWAARHGLTAQAYQQTFDKMVKEGYRPRCVSGYTASAAGPDLYAALWDKASGPAWVARHGLTESAYQKEFNQLGPQGFRPTCISAYTVSGQPRFAGIWEKSNGPAWVARHGLTASAYQTAFDGFVAQGFRPRWITTYTVNGQDFYAAIWDKASGPAWAARHGLTEAQFDDTSTQLEMQGYRLVCASACTVGNQDRYAGLWEQFTSPQLISHHGMTGMAYQATFDELVAQGFRPRFVAGYFGAQPVDHTLRFRMQQQQQSQWCWAATSVSVAHYYDSASNWTQCAMANAQRGQTTCCAAGAATAACNSPDVLDAPLTRVGHFASMQGESVTYQRLRDQVLMGRPMCIRVLWGAGPAAHFIAATGCEENEFVLVSDCGSGTTSLVAYDTLRTAYNGTGTWTHTYFTQPAAD